jgi:hypothetical protein
MEDGWDFCPACGADNRPPRVRRRVPEHRHRFAFRRWGYCVECGEPYGEPYMFSYSWRLGFMIAGFVLGVGALLSAALIQFGNVNHGTSIGKWVHTWYSNPVTHRSRGSYRSYTTELGVDLTTGLIVSGVLLLVVAFMLLLRAPFSRYNLD